jgi:CDP-diacylglycerol--glycerol-3-phosphate 3-phosphatidyltransferase
MDLACSLLLLIALIALFARRRSAPHYARVAAEGESRWLSTSMMNSLYSVIARIGARAVSAGVSADAVTWSSLGLALLAGALFASDHLGVGALCALLAAGSDALDGFVASERGTSSAAGEVFDAAIDRYVEFALFLGLALHYHYDVSVLVLVLVALAGSFMVSYTTAKAEALSLRAPRGSMRRTERLTLIIAGAALAPLMAALGVPAPWHEATLWSALGLIAVLANASAVSRARHMIQSLRAEAGELLAADGVKQIRVGASLRDRST